ncbi:hypothetical protein CMI37_27150 [Candidatus Pacearchaeota archaeon]|nr:hypothetical protein [Candidatus Pacearchaeota archaeon]
MVNVTTNDLLTLNTTPAASTQTPPIFNTITEIIKGINELLGSYKQITGVAADHHPPVMPNQPAERALPRGAIPAPIMPASKGAASDDFGELLAGLIKACKTLETMGMGDKQLAEALLALPVTISQAKSLLVKIETKRGAR